MNKIYVVRHGETDSNTSGLVFGRTEESLNATGENQMQEIHSQIKTLHFDAVYASPVRRAKEAAQIVAPDYDIIYDDRLSERFLGQLSGLTIDELWARADWNSLEIERTPEGAETLLAGLKRTELFLNDLRKNHQNDTILIVTHSFISRCLWILTNRIEDPELMRNFSHPNSEIKIYNI